MQQVSQRRHFFQHYNATSFATKTFSVTTTFFATKTFSATITFFPTLQCNKFRNEDIFSNITMQQVSQRRHFFQHYNATSFATKTFSVTTTFFVTKTFSATITFFPSLQCNKFRNNNIFHNNVTSSPQHSPQQ